MDVEQIIMECSICVEKFNKTTRKKITCLYCQHETCHRCVETYLMENTILPQCMNCKMEWNMEFLRICLSPTFMNKKYKEHQKEAILAEAETKLGRYQNYALLQVAEEDYQKIVSQAKIQLEESKKYYNLCLDNLHQIQSDIHRELGGNYQDSAQQQREFFMTCPLHDCRGKLSSVYKCGMCEHWFCPNCHQDRGMDKDTDHECQKDDVQTVRMLKENTRPCPKCHIGIYKTEGCDQMWCVQCHTCFSWKSGNIMNGVVHNPHFYEYQRRMNGGQAPRVSGDDPCGGMPTYTYVLQRYRLNEKNKTKTIHDNWLIELHRYMNEMTTMTMPSVYRKFNNREHYHRKYGVEYLRNKISRLKWIDMLFRVSKQEEKYRRYYQVLETLNVNVSDYLRRYVNGENAEVVYNECDEFFNYANEECVKMMKQYNMKIHTLKMPK